MAAMSVIGIDFGNESCYVAVARAGGIETIANDYSLRATPSCVAFSDRNRILGVAAKNQTVTNMKNTIHGFKRLLGRQFKDEHVQKELKFLPYNVIENPDGSIGIKVKYLGEDKTFSPEQITAMLLTKLRETSEQALSCSINNCVLSVPCYFTNAERKALLAAANIAGLKVLRLFNETTATALTYGIYKQDLPAQDAAPRNVVFVDFGHSSLQVFACAFQKEKLKILASAANPYVGGRNIDLKLAEYFCQDFKQKYKIEPQTNPRAFLRLITEVERLKKQMSANSTKLPFGIECFMNDIDVKGEMNRTQMEELCSDVFEEAEKTMRECLVKSKLSPDDIYAVEIVGGSSRIPAIKALIEKVFAKPVSTTLNQDEAVARGCALQCAMLSPAVRVRDFNVTDVQMYPIRIEWEKGPEESKNSENSMPLFEEMHATPFSKHMTFHQDKPFSVSLFYDGYVPYPSKDIGTFKINDVKPGPDNKTQKVKVKVRVNMDGIATVASATLSEKVEAASIEEVMDVDEKIETSEEKSNEPAENGKGDDVKNEDGDKKVEEKKKILTKTVDLNISASTHGITPDLLNTLMELEGKMIADDKLEKERIDARNNLEEYVYDLRSKLGSEDDFANYISEDDASKISSQLDELESWLYEEGADVVKSIYITKLADLKKIGEEILKRKIDYEEKPKAFELLFSSIQLAQKTIGMYKDGDERFSHLDPSEIQAAEEKVKNTSQWAENAFSLMKEFTDKTKDAPVNTLEIQAETTALKNSINPLFSKPKPQPAPAVSANDVQQNGENTDETMDDAASPKSESKDNSKDKEKGA